MPVRPVTSDEYHAVARRPAFSVLESGRVGPCSVFRCFTGARVSADAARAGRLPRLNPTTAGGLLSGLHSRQDTRAPGSLEHPHPLMPPSLRSLLVTGGAGFIGANFVQYWLARHPDDRVVVLDALTYAGNLSSLEPVRRTRCSPSSAATSGTKISPAAAARASDHDHRPLRGGIPRRPLDPQPRRIHRDQRDWHARAAQGGTPGLARGGHSGTEHAFTTSPPTRCMARSGPTIRRFARTRRTRPTPRTPRARPRRTIWCGRITTPTACRSPPATAPTTTALTSFPRS